MIEKNEEINVKIQFQKYFILILPRFLDSNLVSLFGCLQNSGVSKGRVGIANLCLSGENLVTSHCTGHLLEMDAINQFAGK